MTLWVDAQLSPALATWLHDTFEIEAIAVRDLGLREAEDDVIFEAARRAGALVLTKDRDFVRLVKQRGSPPQVLWVTLGNTSNARLMSVLESAWPRVLELVEEGEPLVEIAGAP